MLRTRGEHHREAYRMTHTVPSAPVVVSWSSYGMRTTRLPQVQMVQILYRAMPHLVTDAPLSCDVRCPQQGVDRDVL